MSIFSRVYDMMLGRCYIDAELDLLCVSIIDMNAVNVLPYLAEYFRLMHIHVISYSTYSVYHCFDCLVHYSSNYPLGLSV